jgi:hypothetical protein
MPGCSEIIAADQCASRAARACAFADPLMKEGQ